ncbi:MAG: hypothetical protein JKY13_03000, partial [Gammaproteobacteria bacterium]|nr:hypothetical protein [Gammaproteobacteria bacterium]
MSRRRAAIKRVILSDPRFGSQLIAKFINYLMKDGKKSVSEKIVYAALEQLKSAASANATNASAKRHKTNVEVKVEASADAGVSQQTAEVVEMHEIRFLEESLSNIYPSVEVKSRRVGGSTYQVPVEV